MHKIVGDLTRIGISIDFDNLSAHCEFLLAGLSEEKKRFEIYVNRETKNLDEENRRAFFEYISDEEWRINDIFPALQANSAFLLSYGLFEKNLNDICDACKTNIEIDLTLKDLQGKGIERAKTYLSKICKIKEPFSTQEWETIKKHAELRNIIAHTSGILDFSDQKHKSTLEFFRNDKDIKTKSFDNFQEHGEIETTLDFVKKGVGLYRKFLINICNQKRE